MGILNFRETNKRWEGKKISGMGERYLMKMVLERDMGQVGSVLAFVTILTLLAVRLIDLNNEVGLLVL